ncbi:hypothetical protein ACFQ9Q_06285 [Streptomyces virginiae]|uniref:hypothetical protein n=1 Tax=Streptomyces virginiae TaxID=1961 RepID=UPI003699CA2C
MAHQEYVGHRLIEVSVLPARVVYVIAEGSTDGFRAAVRTASHRWGGMTEPIIEVGSDEDSGSIAKLVSIADVQAVVNVDADASRASLLAAAWKLPLIAIGDMKSASPMGIWEFTSRPESVAPGMGAGVDPCYRADPEGPLWAVAVAGIYDPPKDSTGCTPIVPISSQHSAQRRLRPPLS